MAYSLGQKARCPLCKLQGGLVWTGTAIACVHCQRSGLNEAAVRNMLATDKVDPAVIERVKAQAAPPPKPQPPAPKTNAEIERAGKERYQEIKDKVGGQEIVHIVEKAAHIPELLLDEARLAFHKWRLARLANQEKRYGRDDLRKRGFRVVGQQRDERGFLIRVLDR